MAMIGDGEARKLGERLLLEVEVEELSSVLSSFRTLVAETENNEAAPHNTLFGIPELDALTSSSSQPVIELVSPPQTHHPSGAGKTSLLYLIIAHAILPTTASSITDLNGHSATVVLFDPLHHFSVSRLATTILNLLVSKLQAPFSQTTTTTSSDLLTLTTHCLDHVHIFHPQSWPSLLATLRELPTYLFDPTRHKSTHRRIHSLILEDIDAFIPSIRSEQSHASTISTPRTSNPLLGASRSLTAQLQRLSTLLSCATVLTSPSTSPTAFRPALPTAWPSGMNVTRLAVRRVEVLKFAPEMSVEQAEAERKQRWEVVRRGRFEVRRVGRGVEEEGGFVFRVVEGGVEVER